MKPYLLLLYLIHTVLALNSRELLKLQRKSSASNIIKLSKSNYDKVLSGSSDAHTIVLLTATNAEIGCVICSAIAPEFQKLADSWALDHPQGDGLFFAKADFADGNTAEIFQKLQLNNVPKLYLYTPSASPHAITTGFQQLNVPQDAAQFAPYLAGVLGDAVGQQVVIHETLNYGSIAITAVATFCIVLAIRRNSKSVSALVARKELWGAITVISILFFVTGYMFNAIRNTPYVRGGPGGTVQYFAPGQQQQFGAETQALTFIYAVLAFGLVSLITKAQKVKNEKVHFAVVVGLLGVILIAYSVLISIFKFKSPGYPFQLLKIWSP